MTRGKERGISIHFEQLKVKTWKIQKQIPYKQRDRIFQRSGKGETMNLKEYLVGTLPAH